MAKLNMIYDAQELYDEITLQAKLKAQEEEDGVIVGELPKHEDVSHEYPEHGATKTYRRIKSDITFKATGLDTHDVHFTINTPSGTYKTTTKYRYLITDRKDCDRAVTIDDCIEFVEEFLKKGIK